MEDFPTLDKAALNAEIVRALDELVAESKFHAARIKEGFAETVCVALPSKFVGSGCLFSLWGY